LTSLLLTINPANPNNPAMLIRPHSDRVCTFVGCGGGSGSRKIDKVGFGDLMINLEAIYRLLQSNK